MVPNANSHLREVRRTLLAGYPCVKRRDTGTAMHGSGAQKGHEDHEQQDRGALQQDPPLHQLVGAPRIALPHHSDHAGEQHPQRGKHQDTDHDGQESMHGSMVGFIPGIVIPALRQRHDTGEWGAGGDRNCVAPTAASVVVPEE